MKNITEKSEWSSVIQLEDGDILKGGENGLANEQAKALANRTAWLKNTVESSGSGVPDFVVDDANKVLSVKPDGTGMEWKFATGGGSGGGNPAGTIIAWGGATAPAGYLECKGQSLSKTICSGLFAAIGYTWGGSGDNFKLPDFYSAGRFLRSRSADLVIGEIQEDAIRNITGSMSAAGAVAQQNFKGAFVQSGPTATMPVANTTGWQGGTTYSFSADRVVPIADENRPKSAVVMYCIKVTGESSSSSGSGLPSFTVTDANKVLAVKSDGTGTEWKTSVSTSGGGGGAVPALTGRIIYRHSEFVDTSPGMMLCCLLDTGLDLSSHNLRNLVLDVKYEIQGDLVFGSSEILFDLNEAGYPGGGMVQLPFRMHECNGSLFIRCIAPLDYVKLTNIEIPMLQAVEAYGPMNILLSIIEYV